MKTLPTEASVRAAYEAARFDERAPDERGFAARFESEFKPKLVESVGFSLRVAAARKRRRLVAIGVSAVVAIGIIPAILAMNLIATGPGLQFFLIGVGILLTFAFRYATAPRPHEADPNAALVMGAVLEAFGCRMGTGLAPFGLEPFSGPVTPRVARFETTDEYVTGTFDGRIPFVARRITTWHKEGKNESMTFKGWYLQIDLPFAFSGTTVIYGIAAARRIAEGIALKDVFLEAPEFARLFTVGTTNQVEARVILAPDVLEHLTREAARLKPEQRGWNPAGDLLLGFSGSHAHVWLPSRATQLADWCPLDPAGMIEDIHEAFSEFAQIRAFLRDIDVIAESEGFRAQAARNANQPRS